MADLIKKIKIKKQDGTFTDYIPIGAEAQNISTNDGDSVQLKLNKKPYYYDTVANMKADLKLKNGDMAITLGYYEANDGGAGEYRIINGVYTDDGGCYHALNNGLYAELIVKDFTIGVKQYGAKGNGTHDDTEMIQKCINYAHSKGFEVLINPSSNYYLTTLPLLVEAHYGNKGGYYSKNGTVIKGAQAGKSVIHKVGNGTLLNDSNNINAVFICKDSSSSGTGVLIKNLLLFNWSSIDGVRYTDQDALCIYNNIANSTFENLTLGSFNGMFSKSFACTYNDLNIPFGGNSTTAPSLDTLTAYGLKIFDSTSSNLNKILAYGSGDAFYISSYYTTINNCFGSGHINFRVSGSGLSFNGCGSENPNAQYQFYTASDQTNFTVNGYYCYRQIGDSNNNIAINDTAFCCCKNAMRVNIKNVQVLNSNTTGIDSENTGYIFNITDTPSTPTYTSIDCFDYYPAGNINTNMRLWKNGPSSSEAQKITTPMEDFMYYYWSGKIYPFIGGQYNIKKINSIINFLNVADEAKTHTIWLDSTTKDKSSQGWINNNQQHFNLGDIMLNNDPKLYNLGMRVITSYTDDVHYDTSNIPIVLTGASSERPTQNLFIGLQYFDTTLNKPIYYKGSSKWVDATGTEV